MPRDITNMPEFFENNTSNSTEKKHTISNQLKHFAARASIKNLIIIGLSFTLIAGLAFITTALPNLNLDDRQQASTGSGAVVITSAKNHTNSEVNIPLVIPIEINTSGIQTNGAQLNFNISNESQDGSMIFDPNSLEISVVGVDSSGTGQLETLINNKTTSNNVVNVNLFAVPRTSDLSYYTNTAQTLVNISLVPINPGNITIEFLPENTIVTQRNSQQPEDILKHVLPIEVIINPAAAAAPLQNPEQ